MQYLVDTNVLVRLSDPASAQSGAAHQALARLRSQGHLLCIGRQSLIEFRNVASRPVAANGLGLAAADADRLLGTMESVYTVLHDTDDIYLRWRALVAHVGVQGKQVHDARLVASMLVYGVTHLLTFNGGDFTRYGSLPAALGGGVKAVDPQTV